MPWLRQWARFIRLVIDIALRLHSWGIVGILFSSGSLHSAVQHYESYQVGMEIPGEKQLDFFILHVCVVPNNTVLWSSSRG